MHSAPIITILIITKDILMNPLFRKTIIVYSLLAFAGSSFAQTLPSYTFKQKISGLGVKSNNTNPPPVDTSGDLSISQSFLNFGSFKEGSSRELGVLVQNAGATPLTPQIQTSGNFSAVHNCSSLSQGQACPVTVTALGVVGSNNGTLTVSAGALSKSVPLMSEVNPYFVDVELSAPAINFGDYYPGEAYPASISILNVGETTLNLQFLYNGNYGDFSLMAQPECQALTPGNSCYLTVTSSNVWGEKSGTVSITAPGVSREITLHANTLSPQVTDFTPSTSSLTINNTPIGSPASAQVSILNSGNTVLSSISAQISGQSPNNSFQLSTNCNNVQPGENCLVTVTTNATIAGPASGSITLEAQGVTKYVSASTTVEDVTAQVSADTTTAFSNVNITEPVTKTFSVKNSGTYGNLSNIVASLTNVVNGVSIVESSSTCSNAILAPEQSCSIAVKADPTVTGSLGATLQIQSNGRNGVQTLSLTGNARALTKIFQTTDTSGNLISSVSFGTVSVETSKTFRISNSSSATGSFDVQDFVINSPFQLISVNNSINGATCSNTTTTLVPGSSCDVTVKLTNTVGDYSTGYGLTFYTTATSSSPITGGAAVTLPLMGVVTTAADPQWSNVQYLMHFDGTNGSTTFLNSKSGTNLTIGANTPSLATSNKYFGASSLYLTASSYIVNTSTSAQSLGTGSFTVEAFVKPVTLQNGAIFGTGTTDALAFYFCGTGGSNLCVANQNKSNFLNVSHGITAGAWAHIALVRNGNTFTIYVNGVSKGSATSSTSFVAGNVYIGRDGSSYLNSYIDELRVTTSARYASNFTPPSVAFSNN